MGTWNRFKEFDILIPVLLNTDGSPVIDPEHTYHPDGYIPDFSYMENYIHAMQKMIIADVVKYKDNVIEQTKKIITL